MLCFRSWGSMCYRDTSYLSAVFSETLVKVFSDYNLRIVPSEMEGCWEYVKGTVGRGPTSPSVSTLAYCLKYHEGFQITILGSQYLNGRNCLGNIVVCGRIILKWILEKSCMKVWTGWVWPSLSPITCIFKCSICHWVSWKAGCRNWANWITEPFRDILTLCS
jgi:hypothetical protein